MIKSISCQRQYFGCFVGGVPLFELVRNVPMLDVDLNTPEDETDNDLYFVLNGADIVPDDPDGDPEGEDFVRDDPDAFYL